MSIIDIKNEYAYIRHQNLKKYEEKKEHIYLENPELRELDHKIISEYVNISKGENDDTKLSELKTKRDKYLKQKGIIDDYLEVKYNCDKCKDTGFVDGEKCSCYIKKEIEEFDKISGFSNLIKSVNFERLDKTFYNQDVFIADGKTKYQEYMARVLQHIAYSIKEMNDKPYNAIFVGATGTGKTFLATCIGAEYIKNNKSVLFVNVIDYINSLKPDYDGESLESVALKVDLLILDDLGTETITEFTDSKLYYLINKRIENNKSTIITTNLSGTELGNRYLSPMLSRLTHLYQKYMLYGNDLRGLKYGN